MTIKPITPDEAIKSKHTSIEPEIFLATNMLIAERLTTDGEVVVKQKEIIELYNKLKLDKGETPTPKDDLFKKKQLDIEPVYQKAGWVVEYDKPAYNETYDAFFTFKSKSKKRGFYNG